MIIKIEVKDEEVKDMIDHIENSKINCVYEVNSSETKIDDLTYDDRQKIYHLIKEEMVEADVRARMRDIDVELSEDKIKKIVNLYVYQCKYDCNLSYWDNIDNLIIDNR